MFKYLPHTSNYGAIYTIAASSENPVYPVTNLAHQRLSKVWRGVNSALSGVELTVDLGSARAVDTVGLANHNFSSSVTLLVEAGATTSYADYSTTITYRAGSAFVILPSTQTYQHWRITITDTGNTDGFLEAGYLLLGLLESTPRGISFDEGLSMDHISDVNAMTSEGGAMFQDFITKLKRITVSFKAMSRTERETLLAFLNELREETNPLFVIPQHSVYDGWYVRLVSTPQERANQIYGSVGPLTFMEEGGGKIMAA